MFSTCTQPWRRLLAFFLQQHPAWQIIPEEFDGLEAIEKARELQPDLILPDIGLPRLNGIEAARQIRTIAPRSRILFLSGNCCPDVVREALSVSGGGYVVKSNAANKLVVALESVIVNKQIYRPQVLGSGPVKPDWGLALGSGTASP